MIGDADGVLCESGIVVAVGVRSGLAEILQIVVRDGVGVGAERREREPGFLRFKGEGIDFNFIEKIFAALLAGKEIIDPRDESVSTKFKGVAAGIKTKSLCKLGAVFAGRTRKQIGTTDTVDDVSHFDERVVGVGIGLAQVAGELGAKMADETWGQA